MLLTAHNLQFSYGPRMILEDVSLSVSTGESVAILGPSGMGKTTLLSLLGGMQRPDNGWVDVDGDRHPAEWVAWVLQTVNVLPNRTVADNVAAAAMADGTSRRDATDIALTRLEEVGLAQLVNVPARKLSGGELQRVVIARGLASGRPFLLADEPTGQLDRATTDQVVECLLHGRSESGVVIVTHDESVARHCDRLYHLIDGRLIDMQKADL